MRRTEGNHADYIDPRKATTRLATPRRQSHSTREAQMRFILTIIFLFSMPVLIHARVLVVTAFPYIADITRIVGGDGVEVHSLASGTSHPHYVNANGVAARAIGKADLLIVNGAGLEDEWLEGMLKGSKNAAIQPGKDGHLDLSELVDLIAEGQPTLRRTPQFTHNGVNPHHHLDPANIPVYADAIAARLQRLDESNASLYRANARSFVGEWKRRMKQWDSRLSDRKGSAVIQRHALFDYLLRRYDIVCAGSLEPAPGVSPTLQQANIILSETPADRTALIIRDVFNTATAANHLAARTGIKLVVLPHDVGSVPEAVDIFALFDEIVRRLAE